MTLTRRAALRAGAASLLATPALLPPRAARAAGRVLKISHQFPGGDAEHGDFRDRMARRFADEVTKRTNGELSFEIYPGSSLMKTVAQFSAVRKGALDITVYPLAYAGGEVPEVNVTLMPGLVTTYAEGAAWKKAPVGQELADILDKRGVKILTWVWQGGGVASRAGAVVKPEDTKGLKVRGGSREMDLALKAAGSIISSVTSDEIYAAMQTGSLDAAVTSSTSLISYRLEEISKNVTTARQGSFWFMFEPMLMSKSVFDSLTPDQQKVIVEVGAAQEPFALEQAQADDTRLAEVFGKAGVAVQDFTPEALAAWTAVAKDWTWRSTSRPEQRRRR